MLQAFEQQSYQLHCEALLSQGIDYLSSFPELDEYTVEAADGHFIDHVCQTEKNSKRKVYVAGGIYALNLRNGLLRFLCLVTNGTQRTTLKSKTKEITALRSIFVSTIKPSPIMPGGISRNGILIT